MRKKSVFPPPPKGHLRRVVGRRERRRNGVVLVDKSDRLAYERTAKAVGTLSRLVSGALPEPEFRALVDDAEQGQETAATYVPSAGTWHARLPRINAV